MNKNNKIDSINARIKQLRLNNNLTQQEFADKINSTRAMIGQIETMVANPTLNMIINIVSNECILYFNWHKYTSCGKFFGCFFMECKKRSVRR